MIRQLTLLAAALPMFIAAEADACATNADCMPYEACIDWMHKECPDGRPPCIPGESDDECVARLMEWEGENCTYTDTTRCLQRWHLPCETAADCSEGFTCEATQCVPCCQRCPSGTGSARCPGACER